LTIGGFRIVSDTLVHAQWCWPNLYSAKAIDQCCLHCCSYALHDDSKACQATWEHTQWLSHACMVPSASLLSTLPTVGVGLCHTQTHAVAGRAYHQALCHSRVVRSPANLFLLNSISPKFSLGRGRGFCPGGVWWVTNQSINQSMLMTDVGNHVPL